jgi:hypothetical protein
VYASPDGEPQADREENEPEASAPWIRVEAVTSEGPKWAKRIARTRITALIRNSQDQAKCPLFMQKAATSQ